MFIGKQKRASAANAGPPERKFLMKKITQPDDKTIEALLDTAATIFDNATSQRRTAVSLAHANGWTYERIAATIGRSYPATRALAINAEAAK